MKVGMVSPYDFMHPGGVSEHVRHLADRLRHRGHRVIILAPSSVVGDEHDIPDYVRIGRSVPVRSNGSVARIALSFHLLKRVRNLLDAEDFDVLHYHEPLIPSLPITALRFHRGANVATFHATARRNLGYYYARPFLKRYFNRLHLCIAVSEPARQFVQRYFPGDYRIIPNGIDTRRFHPGIEPVAELRTPGKATILFVGRLERRKGLHTLLKAFALLRRHRADIRLVVAGDGHMREGYERWVEDTGIPDVLFAGHVNPDLLPRYYVSADLFCAPSTGQESFGVVLLEAMSSGVPVLASAISGYSNVISDGEDGVLIDPRDSGDWADAIWRLVEDPARRRRLAAAGVRMAQRYDWDQIVEEVLEAYREAQVRSRNHVVASGVHEQVPELG